MAISILYNPVPTRIFEADGDFASGAKAYFYLARTTTPLAVYTDSPLAVPHPWPVIADAYGLLPPVYLAIGIEYKVRIEDAGGSLLYAADGIQNSGGGGGGAAPVDAYTKAQSDASFVNVDGDAMTGNLTINKASPWIGLNKPAAGTHSGVLGQLDGKARWLVSLGDDAAESTANAGSNFAIQGYTDAGAYLSSPLTINRASGDVSVSAKLSVTGELKTNSGILRLSADNSKYLYWSGTQYILADSGTIWTTGNLNPGLYAPLGGVAGNWIVGSSTHYTDGNIYMPWAGTTLADVFGGKAPTANPTFTGMTTVANLDVNGASVRMPGLLTSTQAGNCHIANTESNRFYRFNSSGAHKTQIEPIEDAYGDKILDLKPVFFRSLNEADNPSWSWFGFIAEEVDEVDFRFCIYDDAEGEVPGAWNVNAVVAALVQLVQRQEARIRALEGAGQ